MVRRLVAITASWVLAAAALGCGPGLSEEDAKLRCDQERAAVSACVTDTSYAQCTVCYQECGDQCVNSGQCPTQFTCPK